MARPEDGAGGSGPAEVLDFWFADMDAPDHAIAQRQSGLWWAKDETVDATIRERFGALVRAACEGGLDHWRASPLGWLALIVLSDQFPRNIHRGTPQAFACDPRAREVAREGLQAGHDQALRPIQRVFAYLPLEHAEDPELQRESVARFTALAAGVPAADREAFEGFLDFARRHMEVIERFGRFPHRNAILGRDSSAAERAFLQQPGSSF